MEDSTFWYIYYFSTWKMKIDINKNRNNKDLRYLIVTDYIN